MAEDEEIDEATRRILDRTSYINFTSDDAKRNQSAKMAQKEKISKLSVKWDEKEAFYKEIEDLETEDAISKIEKALKDDFDDVDLWINLGEKFYYIHKENDAIHCFKTALIKEPENKIALEKQSWCFEKLDKWFESRDCLKKIISLDDKNKIALSGYAFCSLMLSDYDASIAYYLKVLDIDDKDSVALDNIGYSYYLQKNYDEALKWFEKTLHVERKPDDNYAERHLARINWILDRDDECEKIVDKLIENNTKDGYTYYLKAELLILKERYDEAIIYYKKSIIIEETGDNTFCLGFCYQKKKKYKFAIMYYEECLKLKRLRKPEITLVNLAFCYKNLSNLEKALELCDEALDINPRYEQALFCKIKCYEELDRSKDVINTAMSFEKITGKNVTDMDILIELVQVCVELELNDKALTYADRLVQISNDATDNDKRFAQNLKAHALKHNGRSDEALTIYDEVIKKWPEQGDTYRLKAEILDKKDRFDEAIENYRKSIEILQNNNSDKKIIGKLHLTISKIIKTQGNLLSKKLGFDHEERIKKMKEAIAELEIASDLLGDSWDVWYQKGNCYWNIQNYPKAFECYEIAIDIDPERIESWVCMGDTTWVMKSNSEARYYYEKASKIGKKYEDKITGERDHRNDWVDAKIGLIKCLYHENKFEDALVEINKIFEIAKTRSTDVLRFKGLCYSNLKRWGDAVEVWEIGIKEFPEDKWFKGICLYNASLDSDFAGLKLDADEYTKKLIDSDCDNSADGYQLQGRYLRKNEKYKEARKILEENLANFSEHGKIQAVETLISCCGKLGLKEKKEEYKKRLKELEDKD